MTFLYQALTLWIAVFLVASIVIAALKMRWPGLRLSHVWEQRSSAGSHSNSINVVQSDRDLMKVDQSNGSRIVLSYGKSVAVTIKLDDTSHLKTLVVAKARGAAVEPYLQLADEVFEPVYDNEILALQIFESIPLLQPLTKDLDHEIRRLTSKRN